HIISILFRLFTYLSSNKTRLSYHWSQLWRTLFSLTRFLTTYSPDFLQNPAVSHLTSSLTDLIAFCISAGDTFLPDPASYDDLYYKVVESGDILRRVKEIYNPTSLDTNASTTSSRSIDVLLSVADHFYSLLLMPEKGKAAAGEEAKESTSSSARKKHLSPKEVHDIIKQGYDTLSIQAEEGLSAWERWREADWRSDLKRVSRCAVDDSKALIAKRGGQITSSVTGRQGHEPHMLMRVERKKARKREQRNSRKADKQVKKDNAHPSQHRPKKYFNNKDSPQPKKLPGK
ncbi:hypothetical protein KEM55_006622, partial [Ascosphaera atra]